MAYPTTDEQILLGVLDEEISNRHAAFIVNKVGGSPDWVDTKAITGNYSCQECDRIQTLVCQIYCPIDDSDQHRTLYVIACTSKTCWNKSTSWTVLRCQVTDTSYHQPVATKTKESENVDDWGVDANDWGSMGDGSKSSGKEQVTDWGQGADDWGDEGNDFDFKPQNENGTLETAQTETQLTSDIETNAFSNEIENHVTHENKNGSKSSLLDDNQISSCSLDKLDNDIQSLLSGNETVDNGEGTTCDISSDESELSKQLEHVDLQSTSVINYLDIKTGHTNVPTSNDNTDMVHSYKCTVESRGCEILRSYYLNVFDEPSGIEEKSLKHEQKLLREYAKTDGAAFEILLEESQKSGSKGKGKEGYEKSEVKHGDKLFHSFMKRLARCPEQVLRYHLSGTPLLLRPLTRADVVPACEHCGSPRQFELQLMPGLVSFLQHEKSKDPLIEFGTVLIYTCRRSCISKEQDSTVRREYAIVQPDPDQHLFKT